MCTTIDIVTDVVTDVPPVTLPVTKSVTQPVTVTSDVTCAQCELYIAEIKRLKLELANRVVTGPVPAAERMRKYRKRKSTKHVQDVG
jgi:hypothetical protein